MPITITRISPEEFAATPKAQIKGPGPVKMLKNVGAAAGRAFVAPKRLAPQEVVDFRMGICMACEYWKNDARFGLGKCAHQSCGCTRLKQKLVTESCPVGKWPRWTG